MLNTNSSPLPPPPKKKNPSQSWKLYELSYSHDLSSSYPGNTKGGSITVPLTSCLTGLESALWQLTIFCIYLQNRLLQTSKAAGQRYSDTSPFSIPRLIPPCASVSDWTQTLNFGMVMRVSYHCAVAHFHH